MIRSDARQEIIDALSALSEAVPEMRLAQLLAAIGEVCADLHGRGLWEAEDNELLEAIWKFQRDIKCRLPAEVRPDA